MKGKISIQRQGSANSTDLKQSLAYVEILKNQSKYIEISIEYAKQTIEKKRKELTKTQNKKNVIKK